MTLTIKAKNPHLALCHEDQGYSANLRHVSLLMKSQEQLSHDVIKALQNLGVDVEDEVVKAAYYSQVRAQLNSSVQDKFGDEHSWLYVEDFNDSVVIFCNEKGLWSANYSLTDGQVSIDDLANPVTSVLSYVPSEGKMLLSEDAEDKLEEGVYGLVTKALHNQTTIEHLKEMFKAKQTIEDNILEEEIQKAVAKAEEVLKAQVKEKEEALEKAMAQIAAFQAEKQEAVVKSRKEAIASVEKDAAKAEELFKSLEVVSQEAFDVVIKSLKAKEEMLENSDLFVQKSKNSEVEKEEVNGTAAILKAKYAKQ